MIDRLDRLRHHPVVRGDHQHHDVGHVRASGAHRRKGGVAGRVQEGDALAVLQPHLIGADVLRDAAVLARHHVGGAERVQQAGLAMVDVAHDGHHRRSRQKVVVDVLAADEPCFDVGLRHALDRVAELRRHQLGGVGIDHVVDLQHQPLAHEELDDLDPAGGHAAGQLLHGDHVGDNDLAGDLRLLLTAALAPLALALAGAADRGEAAHALDRLVIVARHRLDGQTTLAALRRALDAADGLAGRGLAAAIRALFVVVGPAIDQAAARAVGPGGSRAGSQGRRAPARGGRARVGVVRAAPAPSRPAGAGLGTSAE